MTPAELGAWLQAWGAPLLRIALVPLLATVAWIGARRVGGAALVRAGADATLTTLVVTALQLVVGLSAGLALLDAVGIDTSALLTSLGVVGLTLGFAAQDTLGNVISGFFILIDRPFVIGDLVQIDGEYGRVEAITLRSVRIVTPDGRMVSLPNRTAANAKAISYTNFPHLRLDIDVAVGVGEDLARVRRLLVDVARADPSLLADPAPEVVVTRLGEWYVGVQLNAWLDDEREHIGARARLREAVFEALRSAGVDLPYQTLTVQGGPR